MLIFIFQRDLYFINPITNQESGHIFMRLKHLQRMKKKESNSRRQEDESETEEEEEGTTNDGEVSE